MELWSGPNMDKQAAGLLRPHRSAGVPTEVIAPFRLFTFFCSRISECQAYLEAIELTPLAEARKAEEFFRSFLEMPLNPAGSVPRQGPGDTAEHGKSHPWLPRQVHPTSASLLSWAFLGHELRDQLGSAAAQSGRAAKCEQRR